MAKIYDQDAYRGCLTQTVLDVIPLEIQRAITHYDLQSIAPEILINKTAHGLVIGLAAHVAGIKHPVHTITLTTKQFANWWQAVRERFLPRWWLKRYPVKTREISHTHTFNVTTLYPSLPINGHQPKVTVAHFEGPLKGEPYPR